MTDTPETQPVEGAEILKLLRKLDAQTRSNGEQLTKCVALLSDIHGRLRGQVDPEDEHDALQRLQATMSVVSDVVEQAAPLLQSRAVKALRGGGSVLEHIRGGRPRG